MDIDMEKIPIKIIELTTPNGQRIKEIKIDIQDYFSLDGEIPTKIKKFKEKYFELVKKAEKLFFDSNKEKTRTKNLSSKTCWKLGNLFKKFNDDIKNDFEITNYAEALERDFGRSSRYIRELIIFSEVFERNEVSDDIPMAIYRALVWKKIQLEEAGIFEQEKKRLIDMSKEKNCPGREEYKIELINAIKNKKKSKSGRK